MPPEPAGFEIRSSITLFDELDVYSGSGDPSSPGATPTLAPAHDAGRTFGQDSEADLRNHSVGTGKTKVTPTVYLFLSYIHLPATPKMHISAALLPAAFALASASPFSRRDAAIRDSESGTYAPVIGVCPPSGISIRQGVSSVALW